MILDLLAATADAGTQSVAAEFLDRTASTPRVQQVVALSLAPAFLLSGIGAVMNVMMSRMIWIAGRVDRIEDRISEGRHDPADPERGWLLARRRVMQFSMMFSTGSAATISVVIALLFLSAFVEARLGTVIVVAWLLTMLLLIVGLGFFFRETRLAASGPREPPLRRIK